LNDKEKEKHTGYSGKHAAVLMYGIFIIFWGTEAYDT
jgi:hypothetical protein